MSWDVCLGFILFGTLCVSWTWVAISFPILGKFSTIISSRIFSWSFFLSSSSGTPMIKMLGHLTLSQRSLRLSSLLLIRFSFFLSVSFWVYPVWYSMGFLVLGGYFLPHFREVLDHYLLKYFFMLFPFAIFFWDTNDSNVGVFNVVPEFSEAVPISFYSFFCSALFISTILPSSTLILSSSSVILLLVPSRVLFI